MRVVVKTHSLTCWPSIIGPTLRVACHACNGSSYATDKWYIPSKSWKTGKI